MGRAGVEVGEMGMGREVENGRVMTSSGDFVSLGKATVGVREVGSGGSGEGENVGREKVEILVSLSK